VDFWYIEPMAAPRFVIRRYYPLIIGLLMVACLAPFLGKRGEGIRSLARQRAVPSPSYSTPVIAVLCYHDISDRQDAPSYTISPALLRAQIQRLKREGWTFFSLSELFTYKERPGDLPSRVAVLTFDDGYRSFSEEVLPILREEGIRATLSIVTSFIDDPPENLPPLMSWKQVREAERSGLVEIASHSHDLHRYVTSNPYRDTEPSVTTRQYILAEARYEDREEYRSRIREDLRTSRRILREKLGHDVSVLAWPYGEQNAAARRIASEEGFSATLGLEGVAALPGDLLAQYLPRVMVYRDGGIEREDAGWLYPPPRPVRAAQVDLDDVYDPDPEIFRRKVDTLVEKVQGLGATHVFLQACPDPDGSGFFRAAWFQNHQVSVRADIWSMAAHKFLHKGIRVWIRAPSMNLTWEWERHPDWRIPFRKRKGGKLATPWYFRLSPDLEGAQRAAIDFFTDMAVYLPIQGVLFDDDAYMLRDESLRRSGVSTPEAKSEAMRKFLEQIKSAVLAWRPNCAFGRNIYARAMERDGVHPDFSQDFEQYLRDYDLTVVMAYARMEGHEKDAAAWVESLARRAIRKWIPPKGRQSEAPPVMFKFQAYDWSEEKWVPAEELAAMARGARRALAENLGVYPVLPEEGDIPEGILGESVPSAVSERYPEAK
jgi:biofilm PGA synthesis lipoprotein PgaB